MLAIGETLELRCWDRLRDGEAWLQNEQIEAVAAIGKKSDEVAGGRPARCSRGTDVRYSLRVVPVSAHYPNIAPAARAAGEG